MPHIIKVTVKSNPWFSFKFKFQQKFKMGNNKTRNNLENFQKSLNILRWLYRAIGQDIFNAAGYRRTRFFYVFFCIFAIVMSFYAINLLFTDDLPELIRVAQIALLGALFQVVGKYLSLAKLTMLRSTLEYFENIYRRNATESQAHYGICRRYTHIIDTGMRVAAIAFVATIIAIFFIAPYDSYRTSTPLFFFYFPFVREYTLIQVSALNTVIGIANLVAVPVEPAGDLLLFVVVANFTMIPVIIEDQLSEMTKRVNLKMADGKEIKRRWLQYISMHQDYNG